MLPGIGITVTVHPARQGGAILVFQMGRGVTNEDRFNEAKPTVNAALSGIEQHAFGGSLTKLRFSGTNTILEPGRIIFIKDDSKSEWTDAAAIKDVAKVVPRKPEQPA